jgi:hypothetical protein
MGFPSQRISEILLYVKHLPTTKNLQVMTLESSPWISPKMGFPDSQRISKIQLYVKRPSTTQKTCKSWHLNLSLLKCVFSTLRKSTDSNVHPCRANSASQIDQEQQVKTNIEVLSTPSSLQKLLLSIFLNNWARLGFLRPLFKFDACSSKNIRREHEDLSSASIITRELLCSKLSCQFCSSLLLFWWEKSS